MRTETDPIDLYHDGPVAQRHESWLLGQDRSDQGDNIDQRGADEDGLPLAWLLERAYGVLGSCLRGESQPTLFLHKRSDPESASDVPYADRDGIHVQPDYVDELNGALIALSSYLLDNFLFQMAVPSKLDPTDEVITVSAPSIHDLISPEMFPEAALRMYSAGLVPTAESADGYRKTNFQHLMEIARSQRLGMAVDSRYAIPQKPLDFAMFMTSFGAEDDPFRRLTSAETGGHVRRLHLSLLLDTIYFTLAHEMCHHLLGHMRGGRFDVHALRQLEMDADMRALDLLAQVPGFRVRSLPVIFTFLGGIGRPDEPEAEPPRQPEAMTHPLSHNRLMTLAESLLRTGDGESVRADVNAGLSLLAGRVEEYPVTVGWPEGAEDLSIYMSHYSDLDFTAHLQVYVARPPRAGQDGGLENAFILASFTYVIEFALRDRIQPDDVRARGKVEYQPTIRPEDMSWQKFDELTVSRFVLPIVAPPQWWMSQPGCELAVTGIEIRYSPAKAKRERDPLYFYYTAVDFDLKRYLRELRTPAEDPLVLHRLLLGARRYLDYQQNADSLATYRAVYRRAPEALRYSDLRNLCGLLADARHLGEAAAVASWAIAARPDVRPGFHFIRMLYWQEADRPQEAYEEAFLESFAVGPYGEFFSAVQENIGDIINHPTDPVMALMRQFVRDRQRAWKAAESGQTNDQIASLSACRLALQEAAERAARDFIFIRELTAENDLNLAGVTTGAEQDTALDRAEVEFHETAKKDPAFAPALVNLASIALRKGDTAAALGWWNMADAVAPFNTFVFEFREKLKV